MTRDGAVIEDRDDDFDQLQRLRKGTTGDHR